MRKLSQDPSRLVLSLYMDGTFMIQSEIDAYQASQTEADYVTSIPVPLIQEAINEVTQP